MHNGSFSASKPKIFRSRAPLYMRLYYIVINPATHCTYGECTWRVIWWKNSVLYWWIKVIFCCWLTDCIDCGRWKCDCYVNSLQNSVVNPQWIYRNSLQHALFCHIYTIYVLGCNWLALLIHLVWRKASYLQSYRKLQLIFSY